ncbi:MAG: hypothetical protein QF570_21440 [Myxococcota bacterium]|jgi:hypothetical protein|nr:hypothetical protein [Myxococcota bacterium]
MKEVEDILSFMIEVEQLESVLRKSRPVKNWRVVRARFEAAFERGPFR